MATPETEITAEKGQEESVRNHELVRMVIMSSAESTAPFKKLPEAVQARIIDGMTEALVEDELRFRGHWNGRRVEVSDWKIRTLAALHKSPHHDFDLGEEIEETPTGIKLVQLTRSVANEFNMYFPDLLDPVRRVFKGSADTLEAGFTEFKQTERYRGRAKNSSACEQGHTRTTRPDNPYFTISGRKI